HLQPGHDDGLEVGAGRVDGGGPAGGAGTQDEKSAVLGCGHVSGGRGYNRLDIIPFILPRIRGSRKIMRIGVPKETKTLEGRVALVPAAAGDLVKRGHEVWLEQGAGIKSGFSDEQYTRLGVKIAPDAASLYEKGEMIVKVKEPIAGDLQHLRRDHLLFCYLHLAAEPELTCKLLDIGLTGVAFETVELPNGDLPLLAPMSVIAGKIGVQVGTHLLHQPM